MNLAVRRKDVQVVYYIHALVTYDVLSFNPHTLTIFSTLGHMLLSWDRSTFLTRTDYYTTCKIILMFLVFIK
jgi:hypothetical protein